jgi:hypothetical protein
MNIIWISLRFQITSLARNVLIDKTSAGIGWLNDRVTVRASDGRRFVRDPSSAVLPALESGLNLKGELSKAAALTGLPLMRPAS